MPPGDLQPPETMCPLAARSRYGGGDWLMLPQADPEMEAVLTSCIQSIQDPNHLNIMLGLPPLALAGVDRGPEGDVGLSEDGCDELLSWYTSPSGDDHISSGIYRAPL